MGRVLDQPAVFALLRRTASMAAPAPKSRIAGGAGTSVPLDVPCEELPPLELLLVDELVLDDVLELVLVEELVLDDVLVDEATLPLLEVEVDTLPDEEVLVDDPPVDVLVLDPPVDVLVDEPPLDVLVLEPPDPPEEVLVDPPELVDDTTMLPPPLLPPKNPPPKKPPPPKPLLPPITTGVPPLPP
ncbi:hypothetical protein [Sphingomonas sp. LaA6.9]|uniref:hypothetical protein n=1 Tax=Sphingomonas sp. LaA6.9 TaxID=2919914 RepID=UPI001F5004A3|nr:hypothetical protein [Sphingomonas sp. LaA6.9]MCJ8157803.1 hypothetical protein [Sphingomonas sp. LaA6.9]